MQTNTIGIFCVQLTSLENHLVKMKRQLCCFSLADNGNVLCCRVLKPIIKVMMFGSLLIKLWWDFFSGSIHCTTCLYGYFMSPLYSSSIPSLFTHHDVSSKSWVWFKVRIFFCHPNTFPKIGIAASDAAAWSSEGNSLASRTWTFCN